MIEQPRRLYDEHGTVLSHFVATCNTNIRAGLNSVGIPSVLRTISRLNCISAPSRQTPDSLALLTRILARHHECNPLDQRKRMHKSKRASVCTVRTSRGELGVGHLDDVIAPEALDPSPNGLC